MEWMWMVDGGWWIDGRDDNGGDVYAVG